MDIDEFLYQKDHFGEYTVRLWLKPEDRDKLAALAAKNQQSSMAWMITNWVLDKLQEQ